MIDEISNINDKAQVNHFEIVDDWKDICQSMMISMYFAVSWMEPRLIINESAVEWTEDRTGPKDVREDSLESFENIYI